VVLKWDLKSFENTLTIVAGESVEAVEVLNIAGAERVVTAGADGRLKVWDSDSGELIISVENEVNARHEITGMM
jgi:WD40 repeat protein